MTIPAIVGQRAKFVPFAFAEYARFDRDAFQEQGSTIALQADALVLSTAEIGAGAAYSVVFDRGDWAFSPGITFGATYAVSERQGDLEASFIVDPDVTNFESSSAAASRAMGRVGFQFLVSPSFTEAGFGLSYEAGIRGSGVENLVKLTFARKL
jgi:uncharacterized protein with beta-barrel porin domain